MKNLIKIAAIFLLIVVAYGFANHRYEHQTVKDIKVLYTDDKALFIAPEDVNKLLIQNADTLSKVRIEKLDLNESELRLEKNAMIREAEVSVSLDGYVQAIIEQRQPVARIMADPNVYLDSDNKFMPLSKEYTALVPLVFGFEEQWQDTLFELLAIINEDAVMNSAVSQITFNAHGAVTLRVRAHDYEIRLGNVDDVKNKFTCYKAFIVKMKKDNRLNEVQTIDLRFKNQVVNIKK